MVFLFFVSITNGTMMRLTRQNTCRKLSTASCMKWVQYVTWSQHGPEDMWGLEAPGRIIHEVGTARMGNDPQKISAE